ncbi:MAG TPA: beta-ketoacyl synthase N-terminal-like domain-containing protein [Steroidobacteraceae bacterium]|nr:beta-ketoacyl synthase N-terminal-like domain-containing protein [Steroidobacteraceae bacterium]
MSAAITASGILCAGGRGTDQVWATTRAGVTRIGNSHVRDQHNDPIQMGLVPDAALPPLPPELDSLGLPSRARRLLRLASPVLAAVATAAADAGATGPLPVFTGLPQLDAAEAPWLANFHAMLAIFSGVKMDPAASRTFPSGRAASLVAIEAGLEAIRAGAPAAIVGGVDSYLDLKLLSTLDVEGRILGPRVADGFIPGEGAAYLVLAAQPPPGPRPVLALGATSLADAGHRYGSEPAKGEGLANALQRLRAKVGAIPPVATTFAGFNGENFDAKLWGVARLRHNDLFSPTMSMQHPASSIGDTGAASGALMMALAATALARGDRAGPALVWSASDFEMRACALISAER